MAARWFDEPEKADADRVRRQAEARARVARIHAKGQGRSTDLSAIDEQVKERREAEQRERNIELDHDRQRLQQARTLQQLEAAAQAARRQAEAEVAAQNSRTNVEGRTTRDLDNPDLQARGDFVKRSTDGLAPVSSLQSFDGEDPRFKERVKLQQRQLTQWSSAQVAERERERHHEKEQDREYIASVKQYNDIADHHQAQEDARRQRLREHHQDLNHNLADMRSRAEKHATVLSKQLEAGEVAYQSTSDFLTEHKGGTYRVGSGGQRRVPYHMKGYSAQEVAGIRAVQERQRQELQDKRSREKADADAFARQQRDITRLLHLKEREKQRARTHDLVATKASNTAQKLEKAQRDTRMADYLRTVTTSEKFHSNFETSDR